MSLVYEVDKSFLNDSPQHWRVEPLWTIIKRLNTTNKPDSELLSVYRDYGVIPKSSRDDNFNKPSEDLSSYRYVRPGDLVLNKMKTWQGSIAVSGHYGIVSPAYIVCEVSNSVNSRYLHHLLRSKPYISLYHSVSKGIRPNQWDLPFDEFRSLPVLLPPLDEQRRIADFLDAEIALSNAVIDLRKLQLSQINDRESAVLNDIMAEPGFSKAKVKYLVSHITSGPRGWGNYVSKVGSPFLRIANIPQQGIKLKLDELLRVAAPEGAERERTRTRIGDVLVSITANIGSVGMVDERSTDANVSQHIALIRPDRSVCDPEWLAYSIKEPSANGLLQLSSYGGTKVGLSLQDVAELPVALPSLDEQQRQVRRLDKELAACDALRSAINRQLELLAERRQALITAAVTGQIDVTTAGGVQVPQSA